MDINVLLEYATSFALGNMQKIFIMNQFLQKKSIIHWQLFFVITQIPALKHPQYSSICSYVSLLFFISSAVTLRAAQQQQLTKMTFGKYVQ